ncbi:50S ribosomal protein L15 [Candidatus Saccharibacteria bacterium]|nr:50S ribosomal protein L15 [Candidatus Saccharibacteria bacterium]
MKYHELDVKANPARKRVGRGIAAGQGKTAGRGTKGQKSRTGHRKMPATFMGGQKAFMQAVPKLKGFKSLATKAEVVYLDVIGTLSGDVDNFVLADKSMISSPYARVKVIMRGEITSKVNLKVQDASKSVITAIEKAGGSFEKTPIPMREKVTEEK